MNSADRMALIRARCKRQIAPLPRPVGVHAVATGERAEVKRFGPVPLDAGREHRGHNEFGVLLNPEHRRPDWTKQPDPEPEDHCETKRRRGKHHLDKIAEKWGSPEWREETKRLDLYHA